MTSEMNRPRDDCPLVGNGRAGKEGSQKGGIHKTHFSYFVILSGDFDS